jgi:hypothetical protein
MIGQRALALAAGVAVAGGCSTPSCPSSDLGARDFVADPVLGDRASYTRLFAVSDVHGGYDRLVALLARYQLIGASPASPGAVEWTGGDATLVVTGDLIDKGSQSLEVIDLFRALEPSAAAHGGLVITLLGNHEAEFLGDPYNSKADAFDSELGADGLDPCLVATTEPRGAWLRTRPLGARIGDWFFSHAGQTHGRSWAELDQALRDGLAAGDYRDPELVGSDSLLEARSWWQSSNGLAAQDAAALGVAHIVFGHTPDALGPRGSIATGEAGVLIRIDTGMSPAVDDSEGALLQIVHQGGDEVATELRADGTTTPVWRGPPS